MRQTEKFKKAWELAFDIGLKLPKRIENSLLYAAVEQKEYWWNGKSRRWEKETEKPSTTIFEDNKGKPTGIMRLRVMCHPEETQWLIDALYDNPHFTVIEVSEKTYANRHGAGERAYLTIKRND